MCCSTIGLLILLIIMCINIVIVIVIVVVVVVVIVVGFVVVVDDVRVAVVAGMYDSLLRVAVFIYAMITVAFVVVDVVDAAATNIMKNRLRAHHSFNEC